MITIIASIAALVVLLFVYQFFKLRRVVKQGQRPSNAAMNLELQTQLSFNDETITALYVDGSSVSVKWMDLTMVGIGLINEQSDSPNIYWGLHTGKRVPSLSYPHGAVGDKALLAEFTKRLPNFDMDKVMQAVSTSGKGHFKVWPKS